MQSKAATIDAYLKELPADRRAAIQAVRDAINKNIDRKFQEGMQYGMPAWFVPHSIYPAGYHCDPRQPVPFVSIASQKNHMSIYMFCIYSQPGEAERFAKAWKAAGKKLDMGKGCVRFKKIEDVPLEVIGDAVKRITLGKFIDHYESLIKSRGSGKSGSATADKPAARKKTGAAPKKSAPKKSASKKTAPKKTAGKVVKKAASKKTKKR